MGAGEEQRCGIHELLNEVNEIGKVPRLRFVLERFKMVSEREK